MPSFCWPFDLGPKPAMMRPFAGQRKLGAASVGLTEAAVGAGVSLAGATAAARWLASDGFGAGAVFALGAAGGCAGLGAFCSAALNRRRPGMMMRSPTLSVVCGSMLLAL